MPRARRKYHCKRGCNRRFPSPVAVRAHYQEAHPNGDVKPILEKTASLEVSVGELVKRIDPDILLEYVPTAALLREIEGRTL